MSRAQLALRVSDLEASITFYSKLFGTEPAKRREGYANFALTEPPLKLVLIEGGPGEETRLDHLGVEVGATDQVEAAAGRLKEAGLATFEENDTSCCYALQDKVWVHGPGKEPWEVYVDTLGTGSGRMRLRLAIRPTRLTRTPVPEAPRDLGASGSPKATGCALRDLSAPW
ncbi:ArsI/CadI family heavy metal resistance metalloenzyme [Streptomyces sp. NRRL B-3648]|uniref:ArsI/CadI family heavy metal resistance metalloenzyme n=1 Tax=Streptomyces sp. NRRL B-3648 TaxID=1519493 RepID=UPI000A5FD835|nr:ArsI/CadI family heavy metal resistance metalloenzyme [Streptomyces sp. NRRL B-3648]